MSLKTRHLRMVIDALVRLEAQIANVVILLGLPLLGRLAVLGNSCIDAGERA